MKRKLKEQWVEAEMKRWTEIKEKDKEKKNQDLGSENYKICQIPQYHLKLHNVHGMMFNAIKKYKR